MPIFDPGPLAPHAYFLGHRGVCLYLLCGRHRSVLVDSGMTPMAPLLKSQLEEILGGAPLDLHLLTHSHFDHLGCTHLLKRWYPSLTIAAHPYVAEVLGNPRAVERIRNLNEAVLEGGSYEALGIVPFEPVEITRALEEGERIPLGDLTLQVLATPGHTRDSLSFYVPELGLLIPGEALGVPDLKGRIMPEFLQDYRAYEESMAKLLKLPVEILGLPHYGVLQGAEVKEYLEKVPEETRRFRDLLLETLRSTAGDVEEACALLDRRLYDPSAIAQPRTPFLVNLKAMVQAVSRLL